MVSCSIFHGVRDCFRVMQYVMQKIGVFNYILHNYILVSILIKTTNRKTPRNKLQAPSRPFFFVLFFIASTLVCEKRHSLHVRYLNVLFPLNRGYQNIHVHDDQYETLKLCEIDLHS